MPLKLYSGKLTRVWRSIAIATGAGLAVGLCAAASTCRNHQRKLYAPPDEVLRLEPLLERIEQLERRPAEAERKFSERLAALDHTLAEQSASIEAMRHRAVETDAGIQRLISSIDRLSDRMATPAPLPFEVQMSEAASRQATEEPRVRVIKESPSARGRFTLARFLPLALIASLPCVVRWF